MAHLYQMLLARGYVPRGEADADAGPPVLPSFDVAGVAAHLRDNACSNVIVMCGAGISVSAGIPDFRSPGTGLYDNLAKYNLPTPQSVFDKEYFLERPDAFYLLCRELWPDNYAPTPAHHFVALLHEKGILRRCFTQNIDSLEAAAGLPADMVVAAHGNFDGAHVITEAPGQGPRVDISEVRAAVRAGKEGPDGWLELARRHGGLVKPDIVFFGEQLPERFFNLAEDDFGACDLLIVMGTSLRVQPFASLVGRVPQNCPRLLINREEVGQANPMLENLGLRDPSALDFSEFNTRDAAYLGDCDGGVRALAAALGWGTELEAPHRRRRARRRRRRRRARRRRRRGRRRGRGDGGGARGRGGGSAGGGRASARRRRHSASLERQCGGGARASSVERRLRHLHRRPLAAAAALAALAAAEAAAATRRVTRRGAVAGRRRRRADGAGAAAAVGRRRGGGGGGAGVSRRAGAAVNL